MDKQEIEKIVTEIVVTKLGISKTEVNPEFTLKDLGADSLDEVEIILDLEKEFGIAISDDIIPEGQKIGILCEYIAKNL